MPPVVFLAWYALKGWTGTAWRLWCGLPEPVRHAIVGLVILLAGMAWGGHRERVRCEGRIEASIAAAKSADASIAAGARSRHERQMIEADGRAAAVQQEVKGYVDELAKRTVAGCASGADAARFNDGLGLSDGPVQQPGTVPAAGRDDHPDAGAVPARKGRR